MTQSSNKPVHEIRLGNIRATIWRNEHDGKIRHNITLSRGYRDQNGEWKDIQSFGRDDVPRVIKCADLAYEWIFANAGNTAPSDPQESGQPEGAY